MESRLSGLATASSPLADVIRTHANTANAGLRIQQLESTCDHLGSIIDAIIYMFKIFYGRTRCHGTVESGSTTTGSGIFWRSRTGPLRTSASAEGLAPGQERIAEMNRSRGSRGIKKQM